MNWNFNVRDFVKSSFRHLIWLLFLCIACKSLFSTREPEPPVDPRSNWIPPLSADQVFLNLQNAIYDRNVENYIRCLVNPSFSNRNYRFEADPEIAANYSEVFQDWSLEKEETMIQQAFSLVPADSASILTFTENIREVVLSDSAIMVKKYRLELHHLQSTMPSVYEGQVEGWLAPDQRGEWSIYRWIDNGITGLPSWSLLKASLGG